MYEPRTLYGLSPCGVLPWDQDAAGNDRINYLLGAWISCSRLTSSEVITGVKEPFQQSVVFGERCTANQPWRERCGKLTPTSPSKTSATGAALSVKIPVGQNRTARLWSPIFSGSEHRKGRPRWRPAQFFVCGHTDSPTPPAAFGSRSLARDTASSSELELPTTGRVVRHGFAVSKSQAL